MPLQGTAVSSWLTGVTKRFFFWLVAVVWAIYGFVVWLDGGLKNHPDRFFEYLSVGLFILLYFSYRAYREIYTERESLQTAASSNLRDLSKKDEEIGRLTRSRDDWQAKHADLVNAWLKATGGASTVTTSYDVDPEDH
jgi:amino acid permease